MAKVKTIQDLKAEMTALKSVTPWEKVEADAIYHIPPLITLGRREIKIITKDKDKATYRKIGDKNDDKERTMYKTSVFAKFIVKRKKY